MILIYYMVPQCFFINVLFVFTYRYCAKKLDSLLPPDGRSVKSTRSSADFDASLHVSLSRPKLVGLVRSKSDKYKINKYHHDFFFLHWRSRLFLVFCAIIAVF